MRRILAPAVAETEAKRSRFIAHLIPFDEFGSVTERLRREHPKASHIAWAWRHINKYQHIGERSGDDGEPRGCAGSPILKVLRGEEIVGAALLVVRYFGGIRLGTGGMVRAYGAAAKAAVAAAELVPWRPTESFTFRCGYEAQRKILYLLERLEIPPGSFRCDAEGIVWNIEAPRELLECFRGEAGRLIDPLSPSITLPAGIG